MPLRGPYAPGDLVCFHRRNRWHGPGCIVGKEGRSTFWIIHAGIPIVVAESQIRPASTAEVMVKQILELRPSRKRKREIDEDNEDLPFGDDLTLPHNAPSYLELPHEPGSQGDGGEHPPGLDLPVAQVPPPPGLDFNAGGQPPLDDLADSNSLEGEPTQPESEHVPTSGIPAVPTTPAMDSPGIPTEKICR